MSKLTFHYIKSNSHLEVKVDGAMGGLTPSGEGIFMSVYSERAAIPQSITHELDDDGKLGDELEDERTGKEGIVRCVQATLHFDIGGARAMKQWLDRQIKDYDQSAEGGDK